MRVIVSVEAPVAPEAGGIGTEVLAASLAELIRSGHEIVVTHGGSAGTEASASSRIVRALDGILPGRTAAALVTHTEVRAHDPGIACPPAEAVARPVLRPHAVVEEPVIRELLAAGTVVVCAAGGGIPVIREPGTGRLLVVDAIADPQRTAGLLATVLDADALLFLTTRTHLFAARRRGRARPLLHLAPAELSAVRLPEESRAVAEAAAEFVTATGGLAGVGPADNALGILQETTGTLIRATAPAGAAGDR